MSRAESNQMKSQANIRSFKILTSKLYKYHAIKQILWHSYQYTYFTCEAPRSGGHWKFPDFLSSEHGAVTFFRRCEIGRLLVTTRFSCFIYKGGVTRGLLSEVCQCASAFEIQVCQCASWFSILISLCAISLQKRDDDEKIAASNSIWNWVCLIWNFERVNLLKPLLIFSWLKDGGGRGFRCI